MTSNVLIRGERKDCLYAEPTLHEFFKVLVEAIGIKNCLHVRNIGCESYALPPDVARIDTTVINEDFECFKVPKAVVVFRNTSIVQ